jgi:phage terminase large subunit-like protein
MIKIQSSSPPVVYQTDYSWQLPDVTGNVQWNGQRKQLEVYDGKNWITIDNTVHVSTDTYVAETLKWAKEKMVEERELEKLAKEYPALENARKHLEMIKVLVKSEEIKT